MTWIINTDRRGWFIFRGSCTLFLLLFFLSFIHISKFFQTTISFPRCFQKTINRSRRIALKMSSRYTLYTWKYIHTHIYTMESSGSQSLNVFSIFIRDLLVDVLSFACYHGEPPRPIAFARFEFISVCSVKGWFTPLPLYISFPSLFLSVSLCLSLSCSLHEEASAVDVTSVAMQRSTIKSSDDRRSFPHVVDTNIY